MYYVSDFFVVDFIGLKKKNNVIPINYPMMKISLPHFFLNGTAAEVI